MRAVVLHCPYCGEETLEPVGDRSFHCSSCDRNFEVTFQGLGDTS